MKYKVVPAKSYVCRSFKIVVGLQEGYSTTGKVHTVDEVVQAALEWMKSRADAGQDFLTGTVVAGTVVYAWRPNGPSKAGGGYEPVAEFHGEVSPLYAAHLTDGEVKVMLDEFAATLGRALGQTRVYVAYRNETWVLQAEQTVTPTGETG